MEQLICNIGGYTNSLQRKGISALNIALCEPHKRKRFCSLRRLRSNCTLYALFLRGLRAHFKCYKGVFESSTFRKSDFGANTIFVVIENVFWVCLHHCVYSYILNNIFLVIKSYIITYSNVYIFVCNLFSRTKTIILNINLIMSKL